VKGFPGIREFINIVSDYGDSQAIGVTDVAKKAMFDAYIKYDPYKNARV